MLAAAREIALSTGPILRRELLGLLRTRKAFWMAVLTVAGTSLVPLLNWPANESSAPLVHARSAFQTYRGVLFSALALFVPLVTCTAISQEREQGTYELLLATRLSPAGIVRGKLLAAAGFFVLLVLLTFPIVLLLYLLGGVEGWAFLETLWMSLLMIFICGTLGMRASARSQATLQSLWQVLPIGGPVVLFSLVFNDPGVPRWLLVLWSVVCFVHFVFLPITRKAASLPDAPPREPQRRPARHPPWQRPARRPPWQRPARSWPITKILAECREGIPDGWNPVLVGSALHEVFGIFGRFSTSSRSLAAVILLSLLVSLLDPSVALAWVTLVPLLGVAVCLPALSSNMLSSELEPGRLDFLRSTPLSSREILSGKLSASLLSAWTFVLFGGGFCLFLTPFLLWSGGSLAWAMPFLFLLASAAVALVSATAGLLASTLSPTTLQAFVLSHVISLGYLAAVPLLFGYPTAWSRALSPLTSFLTLAWGARREASPAAALFFLSIWIALAVAFLQFELAVQFFEKKWMRER